MVNKTVYLYYNDTAWIIRKEKEEECLLIVADEDRTLQARVLLLSYLNSDPKPLKW